MSGADKPTALQQRLTGSKWRWRLASRVASARPTGSSRSSPGGDPRVAPAPPTVVPPREEAGLSEPKRTSLMANNLARAMLEQTTAVVPLSRSNSVDKVEPEQPGERTNSIVERGGSIVEGEEDEVLTSGPSQMP